MTKKNAKREPASMLNRRATHEYFFIQEYEAGVMLIGSEVKALREGNANMTDSFCFFKDNELYIKNLHISEYQRNGSFNELDSKRMRKLLLKKMELRKLQRALIEKGKTIVPYRMFFNERGKVKVVIALAQGKKDYDKRETLKNRDNKRELANVMKAYNKNK